MSKSPITHGGDVIRYRFTPAKRDGHWWVSHVYDQDDQLVTTCKACVETSAERDAREWIRQAERRQRP